MDNAYPSAFTILVGLEELHAAIPVIIVAVKTVHGSFRGSGARTVSIDSSISYHKPLHSLHDELDEL